MFNWRGKYYVKADEVLSSWKLCPSTPLLCPQEVCPSGLVAFHQAQLTTLFPQLPKGQPRHQGGRLLGSPEPVQSGIEHLAFQIPQLRKVCLGDGLNLS